MDSTTNKNETTATTPEIADADAGTHADHPAKSGAKIRSRKTPARRRNGTQSATDLIERIAATLASGDLATDVAAIAGEENLPAASRRAVTELTSMARNMRRAISRLQRAADSVDSFAQRVLEGGRVLSLSLSDEAASVDATVSSIAEISASARAVAEAVSALAQLAQTTSTSSLEMAASIDEVSANSDALTSFVEETASSIEEMDASVRSVAAATESLAAATNETERSMRAIDDSTQRVGIAVGETAVLADEVQVSAEQGSSVVLETAESMRATRRGIEQAAETIAALGERSDRIGQITRVIDEIADRTNLLALNARILAAQAGQQGRGFAVVAEEIKELSERTARSTDEIDELIKGVRESVGAATTQAAQNQQLADDGVALAERAAVSLNDISRKTGLSASAIRQIAEAAATQSLESHQVTELMGQVRRRAQEIERATSEQARTSTQIGERAVRMAELTEQVRRAMQEQAAASKHIAQAMEQLTEVVEQIGTAVGEQHNGTEEVLRAIEVIRDAVTHNQNSIVQINYTAGLLDHEAASLRDSVSGFRLPQPVRGGHIAYGVTDDIPSLDALVTSTVASIDVLSLVLEGLVCTGESAEVAPALAESWEISADGRTYTFHLRDAVRFHNGRLLEAADVLYSVRRTLRHSPPGAWIFMNLVGASEYASGETEELPGARALGKRIIELELMQPFALFLPVLCLHHAAIVPREEIEPDNGARFENHPVGTGPFCLQSFNRETGRIEFERYDDYRESGKPYVESVSVNFGEEGDKLFENLQRGELAYLREEMAERVGQATADSELQSCVVAAPQLHTQFLVFNAEQSPFKDVRVRRAVAHAINKRELVEQAYGSLATIAAGSIPPGLIGYDAAYRGLEYDPERARRLLAEAGYGATTLTLELWRSFAEQAISTTAGDVMCEQLSRVGIKCSIRAASKTELLEAMTNGRASLAEVSWYADYADSDNFTYSLFHSEHRNSIFQRVARIPEVDELTTTARTLINRTDRAQAYAKIQKLIAEEALCVFLTHRRAAVIHRPDVEGLRVHLVHPVVRPQEIWLTGKAKGKVS